MASKFCQILTEGEPNIDVEILYWGSQLVYERDYTDKIVNTLSVTVVFCREIKTGAVVAVNPELLQFDPTS
jgi:hypothetical protein